MALKGLWAKGLLTSGDPALGTRLGEAASSHVRPSGAGFAPGCTSGMQNQTFPLLPGLDTSDPCRSLPCPSMTPLVALPFLFLAVARCLSV